MTLRKNFFSLLGLACAALLIGLGMSTPTATAAPPPPRPTLTPTPILIVPGQSVGSYIELRVPTDNLKLWTVVQWQDPQGRWHDVETWRGVLDEINQHKGDKLWWVYPRDYGKGPFRWVIYDQPNGQMLAASRSFNLPGASNQHVIVEVTLK
ncbi:hypothetical protein TFLX_01660 [Thermoflexales bacterium]|nr:hypothetical protein TFLX_01660 [Thermoflexales bacterium]